MEDHSINVVDKEEDEALVSGVLQHWTNQAWNPINISIHFTTGVVTLTDGRDATQQTLQGFTLVRTRTITRHLPPVLLT